MLDPAVIVLATACNQATTPPPAPSPPPAPVVGSGSGSSASPAVVAVAIDAAVAPLVDAPVFAMFDHLPVRQAHKASPAPKLVDPPDTIAKPKLKAVAVTTNRTVEAQNDIPSWCQHTLNRQQVAYFHKLGDGRYVAGTATEVAVIDAEHHPLLGIELSGIANPFFSDPSFTVPVQAIDAHADGDVVVAGVFAQNNDGDSLGYIVAIDATTGGIAWQTSPGSAPSGLTVQHGYALIAAHHRISALRLRDGSVVTAVATPEAAYTLQTSSDGTIIATSTEDSSQLEVTLQ